MSSSEDEIIIAHKPEGGTTKAKRFADKKFGDDESLEGNVIFVVNLPFSTRWQDLKDEFRKAGEVKYADLIAGSDGRPKGSAMVTYETIEAAKLAISMFNMLEFGGRTLMVRPFEGGPRPRLIRGNQGVPTHQGRRGAARDGGVDEDDDDDEHRHQQHHQQQHQQHHQQQHQQQRNGPPQKGGWGGGRGGGAATATASSTSFVDVPKPRSQQGEERTVLVSNLPFDCTWQTLKQTFSQVGKVLRAHIVMENGRSRGMGTVEFGHANDAHVAVEEFDGIEMAGRPMKVRMGRHNF